MIEKIIIFLFYRNLTIVSNETATVTLTLVTLHTARRVYRHLLVWNGAFSTNSYDSTQLHYATVSEQIRYAKSRSVRKQQPKCRKTEVSRVHLRPRSGHFGAVSSRHKPLRSPIFSIARAGVIPCEFRDDLYLSRNYNDFATWLWKPHDRSFIRLEKTPSPYVLLFASSRGVLLILPLIDTGRIGVSR